MLTAHLADVPEPLTRGAALVTLWEEMLDGRIAPEVMFQTLTDALPRESDELTVQRMLSYAQQVFWKFLTPDDSARRGGSLRTPAERWPRSRLIVQSQVRVVQRAARHRQHTGRARVAGRGVAEDRTGSRAHARGARLHHARTRARGP